VPVVLSLEPIPVKGFYLDIRKEQVMKNFIAHAARFVRDEDGVTAIEYGLIAGLIALVILGSVQLLGTHLNTVFSNLAASV
jgi:pilus assembly protein Flp/PilA